VRGKFFRCCLTLFSNPTLSATQSELQRISARSAPKYANNARISRLFPDKPDCRERTARRRRGHRPAFSPEGTCAVRFQGGHEANAMRSQARADVPITEKIVWTAVAEAAKRDGIQKRVSLRTCRRQKSHDSRSVERTHAERGLRPESHVKGSRRFQSVLMQRHYPT
jgi:hypothetical protein